MNLYFDEESGLLVRTRSMEQDDGRDHSYADRLLRLSGCRRRQDAVPHARDLDQRAEHDRADRGAPQCRHRQPRGSPDRRRSSRDKPVAPSVLTSRMARCHDVAPRQESGSDDRATVPTEPITPGGISMRMKLAAFVAGFGLLACGASRLSRITRSGPNTTRTSHQVDGHRHEDRVDESARAHLLRRRPSRTEPRSTGTWSWPRRSALVRQGWTQRSLNIGDTVTVEGSLARSGVNMVNARAVCCRTARKCSRRRPVDSFRLWCPASAGPEFARSADRNSRGGSREEAACRLRDDRCCSCRCWRSRRRRSTTRPRSRSRR